MTLPVMIPEWVIWVIYANGIICLAGASMMILYQQQRAQYGRAVSWLTYVLILATAAVPALIIAHQIVYLFVCEMVINLMWTMLLYRSGGNVGVLLAMITDQNKPPSAPGA